MPTSVRRPAVCAGVLLAIVVALAAGASFSPHAARAQSPPTVITFDDDGVLTTPSGTVEILNNVGRCFAFPGNQFVEVSVAGTKLTDVTGMCLRTNGSLWFLAPEGQNPRPADLNEAIASQISFTADFLEDGVVSYGARWNTRSLIRQFTNGYINFGGARVDTFLSDVGSATTEGSHGSLADGDTVSARITITSDVSSFASSADADIPNAPEIGPASRSADYTEATITWDLVGPVVEYEVERLTAIAVEAGDSARIDYGEAVKTLVPGTIWGVDSWTDTTVEADHTYQYRVRARRGVSKWSPWSAFVLSSAEPAADIDSPANVRVQRADDNSQVVISWTAPSGEFDNYTILREELVVVHGSSIFSNPVALGDPWLPASSTTHTDTSILPSRTYQYRVAAVKDDQVGDYSEPARVSPFAITFGSAFDLKLTEDDEHYVDRREFWLNWEAVDGADDYEVEIREYDTATGEQKMEETQVVSRPWFFWTSYMRSELRARGRKQDGELCGYQRESDGLYSTDSRNRRIPAYCYTPWSKWVEVAYVPTFSMPDLTTPVPADAATIGLRDDLEELVDTAIDPTGLTYDAGTVLNTMWVFGMTALGVVSVGVGQRRGNTGMGVAIASGITALMLFIGIRLVELPTEWGVAAMLLVMVGGAVAFAISMRLGRA